ncbi:MAG: hypothetical protein WC213_00745 [Arenimonas sp.]|jgi:hypothetical protein
MKAIYARHLDIVLKHEVPEQLPGFEYFKPRLSKIERAKSKLEPGDRIFQKSAGDKIRLFLIFSTHPRQEEFNLEIGWSTKGRFPADLEMPSTSPSPDNAEMLADEGVVGFYNLYPRVTGKSHLGWAVWRCSVTIDHPRFREIFVQEDLQEVTEEKASERVKKAVSDCLADIKSVALPYFERLVQIKCNATP